MYKIEWKIIKVFVVQSEKNVFLYYTKNIKNANEEKRKRRSCYSAKYNSCVKLNSFQK